MIVVSYLMLRSVGPKFARFAYEDSPKGTRNSLPLYLDVWHKLGCPDKIKVTLERSK